jgi:hypothetical protein
MREKLTICISILSIGKCPYYSSPSYLSSQIEAEALEDPIADPVVEVFTNK